MTATLRGTVGAQKQKAHEPPLLSAYTDGTNIYWVFDGQVPEWIINHFSFLGFDIESATISGNKMIHQLNRPLYQGETLIGDYGLQVEIVNESEIPPPPLEFVSALVYSDINVVTGEVNWWLQLEFDDVPQTESNFAHGLVLSEDSAGAEYYEFTLSSVAGEQQFVDGNCLHIRVTQEISNRMLLSLSYNQPGGITFGSLCSGSKVLQPFHGAQINNNVTHHSPSTLLWNRFGEWWDFRSIPVVADGTAVDSWAGMSGTIDLEKGLYGSGSFRGGKYFAGIGIKVGTLSTGGASSFIPVGDAHYDFTQGSDKSFSLIVFEKIYLVTATQSYSVGFGLSELATSYGKIRSGLNASYRLTGTAGQVLEPCDTGERFQVMNYRHEDGKLDISINGNLTEHAVTPISGSSVINSVALKGPGGSTDGSYLDTSHPAVAYMQAIRGHINQDEIHGIYAWAIREGILGVSGQSVVGVVNATGSSMSIACPAGYLATMGHLILKELVVLTTNGDGHLGVRSLSIVGDVLWLTTGAIYKDEVITFSGIPGITGSVSNTSNRQIASAKTSNPSQVINGRLVSLFFDERVVAGDGDISVTKYVYGSLPPYMWTSRTIRMAQDAADNGESFDWPTGWYEVSASVQVDFNHNNCSITLSGGDISNYIRLRADGRAIRFLDGTYNSPIDTIIHNGARPPWS